MASSINASTSSGIVQTADTSGILNLQSNGTTKVAVSSSGVDLTGLSKSSLPTGSVLQVVNATSSTQVTTTSATYVTTGLTATITPLFSTSKILVIANPAIQGAAAQNTNLTLYRAGSNLLGAVGFGYVNAGGQVTNQITACLYLDSPATTSATTYEFYLKVSGGTAYFGAGSSISTITLMEIAA
jgi:hypothetical protein